MSGIPIAIGRIVSLRTANTRVRAELVACKPGFKRKRGALEARGDLDQALNRKGRGAREDWRKGILRGAMDSPPASSRSHPSGACVGSGWGKLRRPMPLTDDESEGESEHSLLGVLGDGAATGKAQREQESTGAGSSGAGSPNEGMVSGNKAEAARRHLFRKKGKVYMLTNTVTGLRYVGQTIQSMSKRMAQHAGGKQFGRTRSGMPSRLQRSIRKHGWEAFTWEVLEKNIAHVPASILDERERYWIKEKQTLHPNGYNMDEGGQKGKEYTPEMRKAKSEAMMPWAKSEKSRARKREVWADPEFRVARSAQRKVVQNDLANVQSRRDTWDAKRDVRIRAITNPKERMCAIKEARNNARQGVRKAIRRGVTGRDLWAEFEERWGNETQWLEWLKDGERASWMPFVSRFSAV